MNIKNNRKRILAKLQTNKRSRWFVQSIIKDSEKKAASRLRIQALVDKAFPDLIGVKV